MPVANVRRWGMGSQTPGRSERPATGYGSPEAGALPPRLEHDGGQRGQREREALLAAVVRLGERVEAA